ncbi:MAG: CRISPR system precrRNA processing endoribonuclease RAMP protein Cas6 [Bryobacteraceae bacterium]
MNDFTFIRARFHFRARDSVYFPPGKAGNILRGAFGHVFRRVACVPSCTGAATCDIRATCPYARVFEPQAARGEGPSGLKDWPRPFVFRSSWLSGGIPPGGDFWFDAHLFDLGDPVLPYFVLAFSAIGRDGFGPGRGKADLHRVELLSFAEPDGPLPSGRNPACPLRSGRGTDGRGTDGRGSVLVIYDGDAFTAPSPLPVIRLPLDPPAAPVHRVRVHFLTPTELKSGQEVAARPEFGILFRRIRDRISTLRALYAGGPLEIDFRAMGDRADRIQLTRWTGSTADTERRSSRTGQRHSIGGFLGEAEYAGDLTEFAPFLHAARWTGVGRHTVWGNGELRVVYDEES